MSESERSMFERLGGETGIRRLVDELSERLIDDAVLGPMFAAVEQPSLRQHREHYFAAVLGGPEQYAGRSMREAHRSLDLTDAHVDRFGAALDASLAAIGADPEVVVEMRALVERLRPVLVHAPNG